MTDVGLVFKKMVKTHKKNIFILGGSSDIGIETVKLLSLLKNKALAIGLIQVELTL